MKYTELSIAGTWLFEPPVFPDARGAFCAPFQSGPFREALGFDLPVAQVNSSVSARGVLRGLHFADTPPGQAKYVYCSRGAVLDVVVDLRAGSPTFGAWESAELDGERLRAVYLAEGLGHAFLALADDSVVTYLCSTPYTPAAEHGVDPLDEDLGLPWPSGIEPILSAKDAAAPGFAQARDGGLLPDWDACRAWYATRNGS